MSTEKTPVLLILPRDVLDRARVLAGRATTALKLPVSLQIVLRALIEAGLKRNGDRAVLAGIEREAQAVRRIRRATRRRARARTAPLETSRRPIRRERRGRRT